MKKKHGIIKAIISNIAVCLIALIFFVSSAFAWFIFIYQSETPNYIYVGSFKVDLRDDPNIAGGFTSALNVDLKNIRPMNEELAYNDLSENHVYRFQLINTGTVHAMYRFLITAEDRFKNVANGTYLPLDNDAAPLSSQLKYSMRLSFDLNELLSFAPNEWMLPDQYVYEDLLSEEEKEYNYSLQEIFDMITVKPGDPNADPPIEDGFLGEGEGYGEIKSGTTIYYDICFWLSEKATLESANKIIDGQKYVKTATLTFNAYFMQSIGGAKWPLDWATSLKPSTP